MSDVLAQLASAQGIRRCKRCGVLYGAGTYRNHTYLHTAAQKAGPWVEPTADRNALIASAVAAGRTLQSVGDEYGISRARVGQITKRARA